MRSGSVKEVVWIASSLRDLREFPDPVKQSMGFALSLAQRGEKHRQAKPLKGFGGGGVLEAIEDFDGSTFRTVYTVRFADGIYVLHAFQKKAKRGIATPKHEVDVIESRLRMAEQVHGSRMRPEEGEQHEG